MAQSFDRCENVMLGHAVANDWGASTHLALLLGKSLYKLELFDPSDVMSRYLHLYYRSNCDVGEAMKLVYEELKVSIKPTSDTLTRKHFLFKMEKISNASHSAHDKLNGLSGGCNPAQRSFPLAFCPWISDENLFQISCDEARLTHFSATAGQVAGLVNLICRRLLKGDEWNAAVNTVFSTTPNLSGEFRDIQARYKNDPTLRSIGNPAYAPNTLHTSLYCVTNTDSFENAVKRANEIEKDYCPTLVGILAGARWVVPQSMLTDSQKDTFKEIQKAAKCFTDGWNKINKKKTKVP